MHVCFNLLGFTDEETRAQRGWMACPRSLRAHVQHGARIGIMVSQTPEPEPARKQRSKDLVDDPGEGTDLAQPE